MILDVTPRGNGNYGNKKRCNVLSDSTKHLINILKYISRIFSKDTEVFYAPYLGKIAHFNSYFFNL